MAAAETAKLIASLILDDKMSKGLSTAERNLGKFESTGFRVGQNIGKGFQNAAANIAKIGAVAAVAGAGLLVKSVGAASNLEQAIGAVDSVFGKSAKTIEAWGNTAAEAAGLSKREVNEMAAVTGAQLQGMGFAAEEAAKQAVILQKRAADLAATFGGPTADAMQAISSLMRGERDPIERYGVSIKAVDVSARIAAKGLDTSTAAAKKNAEAIAGMELLMEQTAKTQGQFAREANGLAGSQARLRANLENTGAIIGRTLLPQLAKLTSKFNDLLVKNQPAIARFAEQLPAAFDQILAAVERIPWESIGTSLQVAGVGAKALLDAFLGMPPWIQTAVITGWGLNKLTGGALGGIVSELGKGLIKGVLGMNAGIVNINAAAVKGPGLIGDVTGGGGGRFGFIGTALKVSVVGAVTVAGLEAATALAGINDPRHQLTGGGTNRFGGTTFRGTNVVAEQIGHLERSIANLEDRAAKGDKVAERQLADVKAELQRLRGEQTRGNDIARFMASASKDDKVSLTKIESAVVGMQHAIHSDLQTAIEALNSEEVAITDALAGIVKAVRGGAGSGETTGNIITDLTRRRDAANAAGQKGLAREIQTAIDNLEPFRKGRQWQAEQIQKAREIVASTKSAEQKTAALKGIQQDLLSHQRSMAAGIVGGLLDVVTAIKNIKISTTGAVNNQQGGGALPREDRPGGGGSKTPQVSDSVGFVLNANVNVSSRDVTTKQTLRDRAGPTPAQAGAQ